MTKTEIKTQKRMEKTFSEIPNCIYGYLYFAFVKNRNVFLVFPFAHGSVVSKHVLKPLWYQLDIKIGNHVYFLLQVFWEILLFCQIVLLFDRNVVLTSQ